MFRLARRWFGPSDAESLNLFRALYCISLVGSLLSEPAYGWTREVLLSHAVSFTPIHLFAILGIHEISARAFFWIHAILLGALLSAAIGFLTRFSLAAACGSFFLYYGTAYSAVKPQASDSIGHVTDPVIFVLCILLFSPGIGLWGVDGLIGRRGSWRLDQTDRSIIPAWPRLAVMGMLAIIYFGAGFSKLRASGLLWADGATLQAFFLKGAMETAPGLNLWLAQHLALCVIFGALTLIFEISFWTVLFYPRLAWFYVPAGLGMHAMIWITMNRNYFRYFGCAYLIFLSWPGLLWLLPWLKVAREERKSVFAAVSNGFATAMSSMQRRVTTAFLLAILGINLACIGGRFDFWPFSSWQFFPGRADWSRTFSYHVQLVDKDGNVRWTSGRPVALSEDINRTFLAGMSERVEKIARNEIRLAPKALQEEGATALVIRRAVRKTPSGGVELFDTPIKSFPVEGRRSLETSP